MLRSTVASAALLISLVAGGQAEARTAAVESVEAGYFALFDRFCIATGGVADAALAVADAEGWPAGPPEVVAEFINPDAPVVHMRLAPLPGGAQTLPMLLSSSPPSDVGDEAHICAVDPSGAPPMGAEKLADLLTERLGFPATGSRDEPIWVYSGSGPYTDETALFLAGPQVPFDVARTRSLFLISLIVENGQPAFIFARLGK